MLIAQLSLQICYEFSHSFFLLGSLAAVARTGNSVSHVGDGQVFFLAHRGHLCCFFLVASLLHYEKNPLQKDSKSGSWGRKQQTKHLTEMLLSIIT